MKSLTIVTTLISVALSGSTFADELDALQGSWRVMFSEIDGRQWSTDVKKGRFDVFVVKGNELTWLQLNPKRNGTISLDPKAKTIDFTYTAGDKKGKVIRGIYHLSGDICVLCFASVGDPRPKSISARKGSGHTLRVCRRRP